jgi:hypothetical protein
MDLLIFITEKTIKPLIMKSTIKTTVESIATSFRNLSFLSLLLATLFVIGCRQGNKIPVDEAKAREQVIPVRQGIAYPG